jgi:autotransporter passenger strand-loop-strand repeat protein
MTTPQTPSLSDYLNASADAYDQPFTPSGGLTYFLDQNGQAIVSSSTQLGDGFYAAVYENANGNLIVSFEGTWETPAAYGVGVDLADNALRNGTIPNSLRDAVAFLNNIVIPNAAAHNISLSDIFVTGHSLGATEAEYVMESVPGLGGGAGFGGTGVPGYTDFYSYSNFTNYLNYGDPVANLSSDSAAGEAYGVANQDHVGNVIWIGNQTNQQFLINAINYVNQSKAAVAADSGYQELIALKTLYNAEAAWWSDFVNNAALYHPLGTYIQLLGPLTPSPPNFVGKQTLDIGNGDTLFTYTNEPGGPITSGVVYNQGGQETDALTFAPTTDQVTTDEQFVLGTSAVASAVVFGGNNSIMMLQLNGGDFTEVTNSADGSIVVDLSYQISGNPAAIKANTDGSFGIGVDLGNSFEPLADFPVNGLIGDTVSVELTGNSVVFNTLIGDDATAEVSSDFSVSNAAETYTFTQPNGSLQLDTPYRFSGTILGFVAGDTIDLEAQPEYFESFTFDGTTNTLTIGVDDQSINLVFDPSINYDAPGVYFFDGLQIETNVMAVLSGQSVSGQSLTTGVLEVTTGGSATGTVVDAGGTEDVYGVDANAIVSDSGYQYVLSGGIATDTLVSDPGTQVVSSGGTASGATISGGEQDVYGTAVGTAVDGGGIQIVEVGGTANATSINGGTLELMIGASAGNGPIAFAGTSGTLQIDGIAMPANTIVGLAPTDTIDLTGIGIATSATLGANNVLGVQGGTSNVTLNLDPSQDYRVDDFVATPDGTGGTDITIAPHLPPVTTVPNSEAVVAGVTAPLTSISIADADPNVANETLTVVLSDSSGLLDATQTGAGTVTGADTTALTLSGNLTDLNNELATLTYTGAANATSDSIDVATSDDRGGSDDHQIAVAIDDPPVTTVPGAVIGIAGVATPLSSISVADADAISADKTLTVVLSDGSGTLDGTPSGDGTVSGVGTNSLTLTGDLNDLNTELATLTYTGAATAASDSIDVTTSDGRGGSDDHEIPVTNALSNEQVVTYNYTGIAFNPTLHYDSAETAPGNVTASFTFVMPAGYSGSDSPTIWTMSAFGQTLSDSSPNLGAYRYLQFWFSNGEITNWNFSESTPNLSIISNYDFYEGIPGGDYAYYGTSFFQSIGGGTFAGGPFQGPGIVNHGSWTSTVSCFKAGTMIRTPASEVTVEALRIGDLVLTSAGVAEPVRWVGRQTVSTLFADPLRVLPIRIRAGALAPDTPSRDLLLSPDHAILIDDVLIQAGALVNGTSIIRETNVPQTFTYYHVELDDHSLILAENAPAETFVDNIDHLGFDNWSEYEALYPDGKSIVEMPYPRARAHRQVPRAIRANLAARAASLYGSGENAAA